MLDNYLYKEDVKMVARQNLPWEKMKNRSIMITGASGLLGKFLIDVIMHLNKYENLNCNIISVGRSKKRAKQRFEQYWGDKNFSFLIHDINFPINRKFDKEIGFLFHLASNTHPKAYSTDPIGTISANIIGTNNLLNFSHTNEVGRFVFASSNEVYGENRGDVELFDEQYCGYIDSNTLRAGYPESKRCGEALCQAFMHQKKVDVVIPRLTRSYGPTMLLSDTKAVSQFLLNGIEGVPIVLKSEGKQYYSYTYMADAVSGLLTIALIGESGQAYNIADERSNVTLRELAELIANISNQKIIFDVPNKVEEKGFSKATKALLSGDKLKKIGWDAEYDIDSGINRTIKILKACQYGGSYE